MHKLGKDGGTLLNEINISKANPQYADRLKRGLDLLEEFGLFDEREQAFTLEDGLEGAVSSAAVGDYDGHEFGDGWCRFYIYGEDANVVAAAVLPIVRNFSPLRGSFLVKRFGTFRLCGKRRRPCRGPDESRTAADPRRRGRSAASVSLGVG